MRTRLAVSGLAKTFGATRALVRVDLEVHAGEVHAVLGENGAGKSTLMGVLGGVLAADTGTVLLDGEPFRPRSPGAARDAGVSVVHQELAICPHLSVEDNLVLGREPTRFGLVDRKAVRATAEKALREVLGTAASRIDPASAAGSLSVADQQLVEIARALAVPGTRVLVLDEPTSSLAKDDAERLFVLVRALAERGLAVLYVSHFLDEVRRLCDRYTVLRDGITVGSGAIADVGNDDLVAQMAGDRSRRTTARAGDEKPSARTLGDVVLTASHLAGTRLPSDVSFELRRGEILGIAGLVGSGRTELLRAVFGLDAVRSGTLDARAPMGMLSEDRKGEGIALALSVADNVTLSRMPAVVLPGAQRRATEARIDELFIKATPEQSALELSGGNQQKVALARLLHQGADVLLLDEPTRGVDVSSKAEILALLERLAAGGKAIVMVSSQFAELVHACDRVAVLRRGVLGPARPVAERTEAMLLEEASAP
ncbi:MAG: sugar ABC transporter ATP-binding protein [Polyangiaceae bacterium]|nr:sugar ABC transporter ATP-binding protein [Polyangiaceae bacterium]